MQTPRYGNFKLKNGSKACGRCWTCMSTWDQLVLHTSSLAKKMKFYPLSIWIVNEPT